MTPTAHNVEDSRFRVGPLLSRTIAECEDFGARCQYSPRIMVASAVFSAVRFCDLRSASERLQPFPPHLSASAPPLRRRKTDRAEADLLQGIRRAATGPWFSFRRILASIVRLPT